MLKLILDSLEGLDEKHHSLYEQKDGKYHLKVDGIEDTGALKRAKDHEKEARKKAEDELKQIKGQLSDLQKQIDDTKDKENRDNGDIDALDKSWQEKYAKREGELNKTIENLQGNLKTFLVDNEAQKIASEIAVEGAAEVLLPHFNYHSSL